MISEPRRGFFWGAARRGSGSAAPHREPSGTSLRTAATLNQRLATGAAANCLRSSGALPVFTASGAVPSEAPRSLSGSIRTMGDVTVVVVIWAWRCGSGARYSAHAPADRRTDAGTTPAARDRADYSPSAGANQTAAQRPIGGVVRIREGCRRQHQSGADHACYCRLLCHSRSTEKLGEWSRPVDTLAIEVRLNSPYSKTNKRHWVAVPVLGRPRVRPTRCRARAHLRPAPPPPPRNTRSTHGADHAPS